MSNTNDKLRAKVMLSRPKDESLEAFKAWIAEVYQHVTGKPLPDDKDMTEDVWKAKHAAFWAKAKASQQ